MTCLVVGAWDHQQDVWQVGCLSPLSSVPLPLPGQSGWPWKGSLSLHHARQNMSSSPITAGVPNLSAQRSWKHPHELPQALHTKPVPQTSNPRSIAEVAAATSKGRRQASAWPPNNSGSFCSWLCHFSWLLPRCSSYFCLRSRDHNRK